MSQMTLCFFTKYKKVFLVHVMRVYRHFVQCLQLVILHFNFNYPNYLIIVCTNHIVDTNHKHMTSLLLSRRVKSLIRFIFSKPPVDAKVEMSVFASDSLIRKLYYLP